MVGWLGLLCRPLSMLVGFVYPSYASWKALESRKGEGAGAVATAGEAATQSRDAWLTYWVVFSAFNVVEHLLDWLVSWIPFYFVMKLFFIVWLQAPQTRGATVIYVQYLAPLIRKHESSIDLALEEGLKRSELTLAEMRARGKGIFGGGAPHAAAPAEE